MPDNLRKSINKESQKRYMASEASEPAERASEPAGRASDPTGRAWELARRLGGRGGGGTEREKK